MMWTMRWALLALALWTTATDAFARETIDVYSVGSGNFLRGGIGNIPTGGFIYDLVERIRAQDTAGNLNFNWMPISDRYGSEQSGRWNGIIGEVLDANPRDRAVMGAAALTVTEKRKAVVEFSEPFMTSDVVLLTKVKGRSGMTQYLDLILPFTMTVWATVVLVFVVTTFAMAFVFANISCEGMIGEEMIICAGRAAWLCLTTFTFQGALIKQGGKRYVAPQSTSGRLILSGWMLFSLLTVASYTAGLTSRIINPPAVVEFNSIEELVADKTDLPLYVIGGGSTYNFLKTSADGTLRALSRRMTIVGNLDEGINRVRKNGGAMFIESTMADMVTADDCSLVTVGRPISQLSYAFAFRMDVAKDLKSRVDRAIFQLRRDGVIAEMWSRYATNQCTVRIDSSSGVGGLSAKANIQFTCFFVAPCIYLVLLVAGLGFSFKERNMPDSTDDYSNNGVPSTRAAAGAPASAKAHHDDELRHLHKETEAAIV